MRWNKYAWLVFLLPLPAMAVEVETTNISRGVEAWYIENATVPVVHIDISFEGAGSGSDGITTAGRASLAASMLTEGAGEFDALAFQRALEEKAIDMEVSTSPDRMVIHLHCLREHAKAAGELLALALSQPRLDEADLARVRTETISYLSRLEENPMYRAKRTFEQKAFAGHPYANAPYGTKDSIAQMTAQDLRNYLATYVSRGNMLIAAAGDVDADLLDDVLTPVVKALKSSDVGEVRASPVKMQGAGESVQVAMKVPQAVTLFAAPGVRRNDERFYAAYLLNYILGGDGLLSRLAVGVRKDKGLVYSIDSSLEERAGIALITGGFATRSAQSKEAVDAVKEVFRSLREDGVSKKECEDARAYVLGSFPLQLDGSGDVASVLLMMRIYDLGEEYLEKREEYFREVGCDEVSQLAAELLDPARFLMVTAGEVAHE